MLIFKVFPSISEVKVQDNREWGVMKCQQYQASLLFQVFNFHINNFRPPPKYKNKRTTTLKKKKQNRENEKENQNKKNLEV